MTTLKLLRQALKNLPPRRHHFLRAWAQVRWKMVAIITFTGASAILIALLSVAALNVVLRREGASVVEKQIQMLVQASRSVAPAILDHTDACLTPPNTTGLKPLLAYTDEAFPQAQTYLTVELANGALALPKVAGIDRPDWLTDVGFTGLVVDRGQIDIRSVLSRQKGACKATAIFSLPLGSELAKRLSSVDGMEVVATSPRAFRVRSPSQRVLGTMEGNFVPGVRRPSAVVLTVRNWKTGAPEDWTAYSVQDDYLTTLKDVSRLGSQLANWVWLLAALSLTILFLDASGVWMCIRLGSDIATTIDGLSNAARQIASGNLAWRMPVQTKGQLGDLVGSFNEMAISLERLQKEEAAKLRLESELRVARAVQQHLFPRVVPVLRGATFAARILEARLIGGDLYDFFDLGLERVGILCADVSGKSIPAALMMANLQAIAQANLTERIGSPAASAGHFVEMLNQQLAGRFGDNRYAAVFWGEYDALTGVLTYVNAGQPSPILVRSSGEIERLESNGFPVGMFGNAQYTANEVQMGPASRLVIFSDGLTDAQNAEEEEFGDERLIEFCKSIATGIDASGVADRLMRAAAEWSVGTEQFDDTTVVVMEVVGEGYSGQTSVSSRRLDRRAGDARYPTATADSKTSLLVR
jgi:serine phosphatase RsbU (regulator of sigma subunit)